MPLVVYILQCADTTLYVGCTNDLTKRLHQHNHLKAGAQYTKGRRPVTVVYTETFQSFKKSRAREAAIKRLPRAAKIKLIATGSVLH